MITPTWRRLDFVAVDSTNDLAARQPPWTAVVAQSQRCGRGRYRRTWVSDAGGLWLSAVLPTPDPAERWSLLPLAAGWALREVLSDFGVNGLRLRWPNDLMIGPAKLAGILVERFQPATAVVGIGLNYANTPAAIDPTLAGLAVRLADLARPLPARDELLAALLARLAVAQQCLATDGVAQLLPALNATWQPGRVAVTLNTSSIPLTGLFLGVTELGHLRFKNDAGEQRELPPTEVELLREIG